MRLTVDAVKHANKSSHNKPIKRDALIARGLWVR